MSNKEKYDAIIKSVFKIEANQAIDEDMNRDNYSYWDSLAHLTLITALEDEFNIMFETEDILSFDSYKKGIKIIEKYCQNN